MKFARSGSAIPDICLRNVLSFAGHGLSLGIAGEAGSNLKTDLAMHVIDHQSIARASQEYQRLNRGGGTQVTLHIRLLQG